MNTKFKKLRGLKVRGVRKEKKGKNMFWKLENFFFSCFFFITPVPLHFKDEF
jgi:hypothetical protein